MRRSFSAWLLLLAVAPLTAQEPYKTPPQVIVDILDAPPLPGVSVSPTRDWLLLEQTPSMPSIREVSQPMLRLAGARINPATNGPHRFYTVSALTLKRLSDGRERRLRLPPGDVGNPMWAPGGERIAFTVTGDSAISLWLVDLPDGEPRALPVPPLSLTERFGATGCEWMPDGTRLLCRTVPAGRGAPPAASRVPTGPTIQETSGRAAPVRTYQDLLEDAHDEALFTYYFTSQLVLVDASSGAVTPVGKPAIFDEATPSPDGRFLLVTRTERPYSYLVTARSFPKVIEVWTVAGEVVKEIAKLPLDETTPIGGVRTGVRSANWRPDQPASLVWVEALDEGNPRNKVEHRDRVLTLDAPFTAEPRELARTVARYAGIQWGEGVALLYEYDRPTRWTRTWILDTERPGTEPRNLWDRSAEDRYGDPGDPMTEMNERGQRMLVQRRDFIYLRGAGATPQGDRPFLDQLNLRTLRTTRLWRSESSHYETVVALLDDQARRLLTRRESRTEPPNYFVREGRRAPRAITAFRDPAPELTGIEKRLITYERADGIPLSGTLYLPPGYRPGTRLPAVIWAYPTEFASTAAAGQVDAAPNRFTLVRGPSHLLFLTQGYAVLDDAAMPIVGGDTANNSYVQQLVANAQAAVDKLVELGVADRHRIGIGGHSYGAFMTANLLAHSDLFAAGIARSGAYNRSLTPFGFQNEQRTFWQASDIYFAMSPFMHVDDLKEPILLTHGEADNNSGTFPVQSERMYHALKGLGGTARLVMLPYESHGYAARESVLHTVAEMVEWFDRYVKAAKPRTTATTSEGS
ncbi:MAG: S9 family peptidase [Gemmatimonadales bacterium]